MKGGITQDNHALLKLSNEPRKGVIRYMGRGTVPRDDQAILIQQQTEFPPDHPARMREAFAADLVGAPAFRHGVNQLDPLARLS